METYRNLTINQQINFANYCQRTHKRYFPPCGFSIAGGGGGEPPRFRRLWCILARDDPQFNGCTELNASIAGCHGVHWVLCRF